MKLGSAVIIALALNIAVVSTECSAQQSSAKDWQVLFNGKDLSGWQLVNGQHKAEVKDGIIVGTTVAKQPNGFLCTTKEYSDFILEVEIKTDLLLDNSGVQFRSIRDEKIREGRLEGYQAQIENRPPHVSEWSGAISREGTGWLYILQDDPVRQKAYIQNQWNKIRIEAIGTTNRVWVNGIPTAHLVDQLYTNGLVCMQFHSSSHWGEHIYMRDVRIQTDNLKPSPYDDIPVVNNISNSISPQEEHQGFQLLFDGKTTKGWKGVDKPALPASGWAIKDGMLTITSEAEPGHGQGVMMSEKLHGAFELKFDFRLHTPGAVVGVGYFFDGKPEMERDALYGLRANRLRRLLWKEELLFQKISPELVWNEGVIKSTKDNHVEYWLNGYKIMEYQRDANASPKGHILLGAYGGSISYQSIKIRELK
jgi:hypothetical protein